MEDGVPTSSTVEATDLLLPYLISTASLTPQNGDSGRQGHWQGNWQRNRGQNPRCQLCHTFGHTTPHCPQFQHWGYGQQPSANMALRNISSTGTADWFSNTDANQHVTSDLAGLAASEPYLGNYNFHVGDGKGPPISHIGHIKIHTPHRSFILSNVLVPTIRKCLLFCSEILS